MKFIIRKKKFEEEAETRLLDFMNGLKNQHLTFSVTIYLD